MTDVDSRRHLPAACCCADCPKGSYKSGASCTRCSATQVSTTVGAAQCANCTAPQVPNANQTACVCIGNWLPDATDASKCSECGQCWGCLCMLAAAAWPRLSKHPADAAPPACLLALVVCPAGFFSPSPEECSRCSGNTVSPTANLNACLPCGAGMMPTPARTQCGASACHAAHSVAVLHAALAHACCMRPFTCG